MHGNRDLITGSLKEKMGFDGFVISDHNGIDHIHPETYTFAQQVAAGVNAGIDMFMQPQNFEQFESTLTDLVNKGQVPMGRIDDAVSRILTLPIRGRHDVWSPVRRQAPGVLAADALPGADQHW